MKVFCGLLLALLSFSSCRTITKVGHSLAFWKRGTGKGFAKVMKSTDYNYKLRMAEKYYTNKDYNHAEQLYEELFRVLKGTDHFEDIYYKFAYCAYYLKEYTNAENLFKGFADAFPNSTKSEEMDFMRAFMFFKQSPKVELDQTNTTKAMGFLQAYISTHPGSERNKEATSIIEQCKMKLEKKDFENAQLYYDLQFYKAAALTFNTLMNSYPDSQKSDLYKLFVIRSDYQYAEKSFEYKKQQRYEQVITECNDFIDRFPDSKLTKEVQGYLTSSKNIIKTIPNEQTKKAS